MILEEGRAVFTPEEYKILANDPEVGARILRLENGPYPPTYFSKIGKVFFEWMPGREEWCEVSDLAELTAQFSEEELLA